jgi:NAD(P)-dependent dehydrogenase (short-subunit alcohol dehydrogenase family)
VNNRDTPGLVSRSFIVTGAGSGIGAAVSRRLSAAGANVVLVDLNGEAAERTAETLPGPGLAVSADVTTTDGTDAYLDAGWEAFGRIDGLHLNAGVLSTPMPIADTDPADYDWEMGVNAKGVYLGLRGAIRRLRDQGSGGAIVVTASTAGLGGSQGLSIYNASKHAAVGLVRAAALDHSRDGIRVNAICPGEVNTPMLAGAIKAFSPTTEHEAAVRAAVAEGLPIGRVADPGELAEAVTWLLSDQASYVTGATLVVDGGLTAGRFRPPSPGTDGGSAYAINLDQED